MEKSISLDLESKDEKILYDFLNTHILSLTFFLSKEEIQFAEEFKTQNKFTEFNLTFAKFLTERTTNKMNEAIRGFENENEAYRQMNDYGLIPLIEANDSYIQTYKRAISNNDYLLMVIKTIYEILMNQNAPQTENQN